MILFVGSKETDYLQDLTYAGLVEILGKDQVLEFPRKPSYHQKRKGLIGPRFIYPHNVGYSQGTRPTLSFDVSLIILACAKPDALITFSQMIEKTKAPWVFIDGGDRSKIGGDFERTGGLDSCVFFKNICKKREPSAIFKRELSPGQESNKVFPFPFSFKLPVGWNSINVDKKMMDVLFWGVESSLSRKNAFKILKGRYDCDSNGTIPGRKSKKYTSKGEKYFKALSSAKIGLSFRGEGFDTLRYWEIPACGSLMISEAPSILIPNNFVDGKHAVFCKPDLSDLIDKIDFYIKRDKEREEISQAGQQHLLAHHTHTHRAEYFIEKVKERLGLDLQS